MINVKWDMDSEIIIVKDNGLGEIIYTPKFVAVSHVKLQYNNGKRFLYNDLLKTLKDINAQRSRKKAFRKLQALKSMLLGSVSMISDEVGYERSIYSNYSKSNPSRIHTSGNKVHLVHNSILYTLSLSTNRKHRAAETKAMSEDVVDAVYNLHFKQFKSKSEQNQYARTKVLPLLMKNAEEQSSASSLKQVCVKCVRACDRIGAVRTVAVLNNEFKELEFCCLKCVDNYSFKL
jgi:hypothetical protein